MNDGWIKLSERLPDKFPCQIYGPKAFKDTLALKDDPDNGRMFTSTTSWLRYEEFTHWKPLKLSDPPKPEVPKDEQAYYDWWEKQPTFGIPLREFGYHAWCAALEFAKGKL